MCWGSPPLCFLRGDKASSSRPLHLNLQITPSSLESDCYGHGKESAMAATWEGPFQVLFTLMPEGGWKRYTEIKKTSDKAEMGNLTSKGSFKIKKRLV